MRVRALLLLLAACGTGEVASPGATPAEATTASQLVTFHHDVEPILQKVCQSCHVDGGIAPFALGDYSQAKAVAADMVAMTGARKMPPWGARTTSECTPPFGWKDSLELSDAEIATIKAWHDGGDVEGDAVAGRAGGAATVLDLPDADSVAPAPFTLSASTKDTLRCFVLDPKLTKTRYLDAFHFVPTNRTIVHHALMFAIAADKTPPSDEYDCFGGPNVDGASLVAAWAPGSAPTVLPPGAAIPIDAGTRFVMQVHYHPHANGTRDPDATKFEYHLTDVEPEWTATPLLLGNFRHAVAANGVTGLLPGDGDPATGPEFLIPAGATNHVETMRVNVPAILPPVRLARVGAHMHLAGRDEKITLTSGGKEQCMLQVPAWDFDWQRTYAYDAPIESLPIVKGGDQLDIRCTYDNTLGNPKLGAALEEANIASPLPIKLGESTTDEMCLGVFMFLSKGFSLSGLVKL